MSMVNRFSTIRCPRKFKLGPSDFEGFSFLTIGYGSEAPAAQRSSDACTGNGFPSAHRTWTLSLFGKTQTAKQMSPPCTTAKCKCGTTFSAPNGFLASMSSPQESHFIMITQLCRRHPRKHSVLPTSKRDRHARHGSCPRGFMAWDLL